MLLLGTVYVFSIILAVFLTGLAIGSAAGSALLKRINPRAALGWCQILLTVTVAWAAYTIVHILPSWKDNVLVTADAWRMYGLDLNRCLLALLPATLLWGASFPLACAAAAEMGGEPGIIAGEVYAANTVGGIVGALLMSLVLIPGIGSQQSERLLVIASALAGWLILMPLFSKIPLRRRCAGRLCAAGRFSDLESPAHSRRSDRLRPPHADQRRQFDYPLHRRRPQLFGRDFASGTTAPSTST